MTPIHAASVPLIKNFLKMMWSHSYSLSRLNRAWAVLEPRLQLTRAWVAVKGPLAATALTFQRLGWSFTPLALTSPQGRVLRPTVDSPKCILRHVCLSIQQWQWQKVLQRAGDPNPQGLEVWTEPH